MIIAFAVAVKVVVVYMIFFLAVIANMIFIVIIMVGQAYYIYLAPLAVFCSILAISYAVVCTGYACTAILNVALLVVIFIRMLDAGTALVAKVIRIVVYMI